MLNTFLDISPEVAMAQQDGRPVVALESTIITHGMPFPKNVATAREEEEMVRKYGAVPATIALLNGRLRVGLGRRELERLGRSGGEVNKASRRDLPFLIARNASAGTTVAATMCIAAMAGIRVFATGGIGGVHRGAAESFDVSADLQELARTQVAVVSAGAKAILDIGLTLEYLETHSVPVIGYRTLDFPAFYTRRSGFKVDYQIDSLEELARALQIKWSSGLRGGALIANPIPEPDEMDHYYVDLAIRQALDEAEAKGIKGKALTPYLLARIEELTKGASLEANISLVLNNARLAARLALALAALKV